jgi:nitrous-oxide reductase
MPISRSTLIRGATIAGAIGIAAVAYSCRANTKPSLITGDASSKVYVAPGQYDEFYAFMSGGFNGQVSVYGLPSGRMLKLIPVFSQHAENGWGYNEETKPMLQTTRGFIPWDDTHHAELSQTNGVPDGRWLFINGNNTPRVARIDLTRFETDEILEIPNAAGGHASPFTTPNTKYIVSATRFSVPIPNADVSIDSYAKNFRGTMSFITADQPGKMDIAFQILMPGFNYDLGHAGKGPSEGWFFFTSYNSEQAFTKLESNASKNDKDFIAAVNYAKAESCVADGKAKSFPSQYMHNYVDEKSRVARSETKTSVKMLDPNDCPGLVYYLPTPKSPHGVDVDPTGEYIVAGGKLASLIPVHSFTKLQKAIADKAFETTIEGIPVLKYEAVLAGEVQKPGLGPLHTEFDGKGYAYTSMFISSEIVKWKLGTWEVVDRVPTYYSIGHLMIPGGDSKAPFGKYVVAMNKITKGPVSADRRRAHAVRAALRHQRRQNEAAARLPDDRRAALRAGAARGDDPRQADQVLLAQGQRQPARRSRRDRDGNSAGRQTRRCEDDRHSQPLRAGQHQRRAAGRHRLLPRHEHRAGLGHPARLRDPRRRELRAHYAAG